MSEKVHSSDSGDVTAEIARLVGNARAAQAVLETYSQQRVDDVVAAAAWAIYEPGRARALAELSVEATGLGCCRGQDHQESAQDHRHPARPDRREVGRCHRRGRRARHHRVRQAGRCGGGSVPVHKPRGHSCEQDDHGAQGRQRRDPFAVAQGGVHLRAAGGLHPRRTRQGGRTARPRAVHRGAEQGVDERVDEAGGPRRRHRFPAQRAGGLQQRHPGDRGRRGQRPGDHRRRCGPRRRRRQDQAQQGVRLRDELLLGKLRAHRRRRLRRRAQPPARPAAATC